MKRLVKKAESLFEENGSINEFALEEILDNGVISDFHNHKSKGSKQTQYEPGEPPILEVGGVVTFDFSKYELTPEQQDVILKSSEVDKFAANVLENEIKNKIDSEFWLETSDVEVSDKKFESGKLTTRVYYNKPTGPVPY